jgi:NAD(P)-dependent dehydrogenase (short-subunit alcohol dehydrogenase family)
MIQTQKVAIITGASRGIGAGLVTAYRKLGYAVVATSRSVESTDPEVLAVTGDLSRPGTGADVVEQVLNRFGRIDTLVNDAGVFIAKAFTDYTDEDYDTVTGVNLRGFFDISRSAIAAMLAHGSGGHLVNGLCCVGRGLGAGHWSDDRFEVCLVGSSRLSLPV